MPLLISVPEIKRASNADLIETTQKIHNVLMERELNKPDFDIDEVFRVLLASECFSDSRKISTPMLINDAMVGVPSMMPKKDSSGRTRGNSVIPIVQVPGGEPYLGYAEDTATFVDKRATNLRGGRSVTIHSIVPGMIISFHHYSEDPSGFRSRDRIDAVRVIFDEDNDVVFETLSEEDALFNMPDLAREG